MHQTAQRTPLASKTSRSFADRRQPLKSGANGRATAPSPVRRSAGQSDITQLKGGESARKQSGQGQSQNQVSKEQMQSAIAKPSPYQPSHQVELLHLQAEVDALMVKLQAVGQKTM